MKIHYFCDISVLNKLNSVFMDKGSLNCSVISVGSDTHNHVILLAIAIRSGRFILANAW